MAALISLIGLAALVVAIVYAAKKQWRSAGISAAVCVLAMIIVRVATASHAPSTSPLGNDQAPGSATAPPFPLQLSTGSCSGPACK